MIEAPPVQRPPSLTTPAMVLSISAVLWLVATVLATAPGRPGWAILLGVVAFLYSLFMVVTWLILIAAGLINHRRIGAIGWIVVPLAIALAWIPPWRDWQLRRAFHRAEPALVAMAAEFDAQPIGEKATVGRRVGPFEVVWVMRFAGGTIFTTSRSPDGESGLVYSTSGALPTPPDWAVKSSLTPFEPNWWRYWWSDE